MKAEELPDRVFILDSRDPKENTDGVISIVSFKDAKGHTYLCVWESRAALREWQAAEDELERLSGKEVDRNTLLMGLLAIPEVEFLVFNPRQDELDADDLDADDLDVAQLPEEKVVRLHDFLSVWGVMEGINRELGMEDFALRFMRKMGETHSELKPMEVMDYATSVQESFTAKMAAARGGDEIEATGDEAVLLACYAGLDAGSADLEADPSFDSENSFTYSVADDGTGWAKRNRDAQRAIQKCPPPPECRRCGERTWSFISLSPNETAATWKCEYCNKKEIVRAIKEVAPRRAEGEERPPLRLDDLRGMDQEDAPRRAEGEERPPLRLDDLRGRDQKD